MGCSGKKATLPPIESLPTISALQKYYDAKVYPVEKRHNFSEMYSPGFTQAELEGKPIVMLLGQYSVGKTSMIEYLLNGRYPGAEIGPEPTTDIFAHIQYSEVTAEIDGQTLAQNSTYPLKRLECFGDAFLKHLRATNFKADLLQHISILDTPGILAGKKQTEARGFDFAAVIRFLAERVDKIILMFDANKTDLSDEYKDVIKSLDGHNEKVRIVLNKCDSIKPRELIQVRGALMWSLGKILNTPEVPKVYLGSFWKYKSEVSTMSKTMEEDTAAFVKEICELVNSCRNRRINDVVKRAKQVRLHAYIMHELMKSQFFFNMPVAVNRKNLAKVFTIVQKKYNIVPSDMPNEEDFQDRALKTKGKEWKKMNKKLMQDLDVFLTADITKLISRANQELPVEVNFQVMEKVDKPSELEFRKSGNEKQQDEERKSKRSKRAKKSKRESSREKKEKSEGDEKKEKSEKKNKSKKESSEKKNKSKKEKSEKKDKSKKESSEKKNKSKKETSNKEKSNKSKSKSKKKNKNKTKSEDKKEEKSEDKKSERKKDKSKMTKSEKTI